MPPAFNPQETRTISADYQVKAMKSLQLFSVRPESGQTFQIHNKVPTEVLALYNKFICTKKKCVHLKFAKK